MVKVKLSMIEQTRKIKVLKNKIVPQNIVWFVIVQLGFRILIFIRLVAERENLMGCTAGAFPIHDLLTTNVEYYFSSMTSM